MSEPGNVCKCIICSGTIPAGEGVLSRRKGTLRFIAVSLAKNDNLADGLTAESRILYHEQCRKAYTTYTVQLPRDIAAIRALANWAKKKDALQISMVQIFQEAQRFPELKSVDARYVEDKICELLKKDFIVSSREGAATVFSRKNSIEHLLGELFDTQNRSAMLKVKEVAEMIRSEISQLPSDSRMFPTVETLEAPFLEVPPATRNFLETIVGKRIEHETMLPLLTVFQILRKLIVGRSYISPIQFHLGSILYQRMKSKKVLQYCSKLGLTATYEEMLNFFKVHASQEPKVGLGGYIQFAWDNLDISSFTYEGEVQLHHLVGLLMVSPGTELCVQEPILRVPMKKIPEDILILEVLSCPIKAKNGMADFKYQDVFESEKNAATEHDFQADCANWLQSAAKTHMGWKAWCEEQYGTQEPTLKAAFQITPQVPQPANDYDSIYSAMKATTRMGRMSEQTKIIFTTDEALYFKTLKVHLALRDEDEDIDKLLPSLGPWHLWLNFLGAIGCIMSGSGLEELIQVIYSQRTRELIMEGKDFQRALRAHLLIHEAILLLAKDLEITSDQMINRGPTSALWSTYIRMIEDLKRSIWSVKLAKFDYFLEATAKMLPIFHAAGHHLYTKAAHANIQVLREEVQNLPPVEKSRLKREWAIRRTSHTFGANGADLVIESEAIKRLKAPGGMPGRGTQREVVTKFLKAAPLVAEIEKRMDRLCGISKIDAKHPERGLTTQRRDEKLVTKLKEMLQKGGPFVQRSDLSNIFSSKIFECSNAHLAYSIGNKSYQTFVGKAFEEAKIQSKVTQMEKAPKPTKCSCTRECTKGRCTCLKLGKYCSESCKSCVGRSCIEAEIPRYDSFAESSQETTSDEFSEEE